MGGSAGGPEEAVSPGIQGDAATPVCKNRGRSHSGCRFKDIPVQMAIEATGGRGAPGTGTRGCEDKVSTFETEAKG